MATLTNGQPEARPPQKGIWILLKALGLFVLLPMLLLYLVRILGG